MNYYDEIILEDYFLAEKMTREERNFYIYLLLNTKDVCDSEYRINRHASKKYIFDSLVLSKLDDGSVFFDGVIYNKDEIRTIYGGIVRKENM